MAFGEFESHVRFVVTVWWWRLGSWVCWVGLGVWCSWSVTRDSFIDLVGVSGGGVNLLGGCVVLAGGVGLMGLWVVRAYQCYAGR